MSLSGLFRAVQNESTVPLLLRRWRQCADVLDQLPQSRIAERVPGGHAVTCAAVDQDPEDLAIGLTPHPHGAKTGPSAASASVLPMAAGAVELVGLRAFGDLLRSLRHRVLQGARLRGYERKPVAGVVGSAAADECCEAAASCKFSPVHDQAFAPRRQYKCMENQAGSGAAEPSLLIFDCDGVLVDSEILVCTAVSEELTRLGYGITPAEVVHRFAGRPEREILAEVAEHWGRPVPAAYYKAMKHRVDLAFRTELQAIAGVAPMLARVRIPKCVASSSAPAKLEQGLRHTGLLSYFRRSERVPVAGSAAAPDVVSAQWVIRGKPAPDVFVFAAGCMRTPVHSCLVVEDSVPGVRAACAAGMRVFGFTGGSHCGPAHAERLLEAGAERVLTHMDELPAALPSAFAENGQNA